MPQAQDSKTRLKQWLETGEVRLQPLTLTQRELWEAPPVPVGDPANHICAYIHVKGALTPKNCEAALQKVVDRQEVFRLSFLPGKEKPMQMIRKTGKLMLAFRDLPSEEEQPGALEEYAEAVFSKPFDMVSGPLYRAEMLRRADDDHVLVFAIHHAIADGWTLGVFVQDLFSAYVQVLRGVQTPLPPVPQPYSEWGAAERAFWQPAELEPRLSFWKSKLKDLTPLWKTPVGLGPTTGQRKRWVSHIPADLGRGVRELARRHGATLFSTMLATFQVALSKWTGVDDIIVGTPVANRNKQAVRETMGYCAGIVPLRGQINRTHTFAERLRTVHEATVESFANAVPFAELVKALGVSPPEGNNPIFQVRFALQNHPVPDITVNGISLQLRMRSTGTARFDLACEITEMGDALEVVWLFRLDLFAIEDMQKIDRLLLAVLTEVCHSPGILTAVLMTHP